MDQQIPDVWLIKTPLTFPTDSITLELPYLWRTRVRGTGEQLILSQLNPGRHSLRGPSTIVDVKLTVGVGGHG